MFSILKIIIFLRPFFSYVILFWPTIFFSIILLSFLSLYILKNKLDFKKIKPLWLVLFLFSLSLTFSIILSSNYVLSMGQLYNYIIYLLIFLISASFSFEQKKQIINTFIFCAFLISILSISQYLFGMNFLFKYIKQYDVAYDFNIIYIQNKRAFFPLTTPTALAGFLILSVPFMLENKKLYPLLFIVLVALFFSKSIGAFISLSFGLILYFYLKEKKYSLRILKIVFFIGIVILIILFIRQKTSAELNLFLSLNRRLGYWKETLLLIKKHPFVGWGLGNFELNSTRYSHNIILQILAENGPLGLFSFLWLIILCLKCTFLNVENSLDKNFYLKIITANIIFLTHNLIDFTFFLPEVSSFWWLILGMGI